MIHPDGTGLSRLVTGTTLIGWVSDEPVQTGNDPPVLDGIGDRSVDLGDSLTFTVTAADPDGDTMTFSATGLPAGADFDAAAATFSWTPDTAGTYPGVTFQVSDGELTDSETITITVNDTPTEETQPAEETPPAGGTPPTEGTPPAGGTQPAEEPVTEYSLNVTVTGNGTVTREPDQATYASGSNVTLTAAPDDGWTFTGWSGNLTGMDNPAVATMSGNLTITAAFTEESNGCTTSLKDCTSDNGTIKEDITCPSNDECLEVSIPEGCCVSGSDGNPVDAVTITTVVNPGSPPPGTSFAGNVYQISPQDAALTAAALLSLRYLDEDNPGGIDIASLNIAVWNAQTGTWERLSSIADPLTGVITAQIDRFSRYALIFDTPVTSPADDESAAEVPGQQDIPMEEDGTIAEADGDTAGEDTPAAVDETDDSGWSTLEWTLIGVAAGAAVAAAGTWLYLSRRRGEDYPE